MVDGMDINPLIPMEWLCLAAIAALAVAAALAWRSSGRCTRQRRLLMTAARLLGVGTLFLIALNPGHWQRHLEEKTGEWALLLDQSASMSATDGDDSGQTRWRKAVSLARQVLADPALAQSAALYTVAGTATRMDIGDLETTIPDGTASDIASACRDLLNRYRADGRLLTGILLLSDGQQVPLTDAASLTALARARETPIHTLTIGGPLPRRDLSVRFRRPRTVAFAGQEARVTVDVTAAGFEPLRLNVALTTPDGKTGSSQSVSLEAGKSSATAVFTLTPDVKGHLPIIATVEVQSGEQNIQNNTDRAALLVLDQKIRVLTLEGIPHWDSKFLLQLLHNQPNIEVTSLYRLTADRFFRVTPGRQQADDADAAEFPDGEDALNHYDLIIFGKGVEYFLTPARIERLRRFLRDQGGGVLFARGRPYSREFPELATLEPLTWGAPTGQSGRLKPLAAGTEAGLFGDTLPSADAPVWNRLPPLLDMHRAAALSPFTLVLAEAVAESASAATPLILARRVGKGLVVTVNAGDFWKWDFFPEIKESREMYADLWSQLVQWIVTYSEFLPGESGSLKLSPAAVHPGDPVRAVIQFRPDTLTDDQHPLLRIRNADGQAVLELQPALNPTDPHRRDAFFTLEAAGDYLAEVMDPATNRQLAQTVAVRVLPPPSESDNPDADPEFMRRLALQSGGRTLTADTLQAAAVELRPENRLIPLERAIWKPFWNRAWFLLLATLFFSIEWFARRRGGLA